MSMPILETYLSTTMELKSNTSIDACRCYLQSFSNNMTFLRSLKWQEILKMYEMIVAFDISRDEFDGICQFHTFLNVVPLERLTDFCDNRTCTNGLSFYDFPYKRYVNVI